EARHHARRRDSQDDVTARESPAPHRPRHSSPRHEGRHRRVRSHDSPRHGDLHAAASVRRRFLHGHRQRAGRVREGRDDRGEAGQGAVRAGEAMTRVLTSVLIVVFALPLVLSGAHRDLPQAGRKTLFALALNKDDSPAADLTRDDWRLMEDGVDRLVTDVKIAAEPIDMTLVVDTSLGAQGSLGQLRAALISFTHRIFSGNPGATISVFDVGNAAVRVADRVTVADDLDKVLKRTATDRSLAAVVLEGMTEAARKLSESPSP